MIVTCTECDKKLKVGDDLAGKKVRCPKCKALVAVPSPDEDIGDDDVPPLKKTAKPKKNPILEDDEDEPIPPAKKPAKKPIDEDEESDEDDEEEDDDGDDERLRCAKCRSTKVVQLPPNQWSRNPGFECEACGASMRQPGTTGFLLFVMLLGGFISLLGVGLLVGAFTMDNFRARSIGASVMIGFAGFSAAMWAIRQFFLPIPINAPEQPSRIWLWILLPIVIIGVLLVCVGGGLFVMLYYIQEGF